MFWSWRKWSNETHTQTPCIGTQLRHNYFAFFFFAPSSDESMLFILIITVDFHRTECRLAYIFTWWRLNGFVFIFNDENWISHSGAHREHTDTHNHINVSFMPDDETPTDQSKRVKYIPFANNNIELFIYIYLVFICQSIFIATSGLFTLQFHLFTIFKRNLCIMNLIKYTFLCYYHKNQKTPQKYGFIRTQSTHTHTNTL